MERNFNCRQIIHDNTKQKQKKKKTKQKQNKAKQKIENFNG